MAGEERHELWKAEWDHAFSGWDFSHLDGRRIEEPVPWSYAALARECLRRASSALDLGTGGGERLLELRDAFPERIAATEGHPPNLRLARERLEPLGVDVHAASASLSATLPFADDCFDLVLDRHTGFNAAEVARILAPGGIFVTQQVDGRQTDLQAAFDAQALWPDFTLNAAHGLAQGAGLEIELAREWTGEVRYTDVGAIVYHLKAVPWLVPGFGLDTHRRHLEVLQRHLETHGSLVFHQTLMLVKARKCTTM